MMDEQTIKGLVAREPKYQWGQPVQTVADIINDGSYPDLPADALLAPLGSRGEIVNVGMMEEEKVPIYLVEFSDGKVIGVLEEEIAAI